MRRFAFLAVAAAAFAFLAPSPAQAQIVVRNSASYYGSYSGGYSPYGYGGTNVYGGNLGIIPSGYGVSNYGSYPSYSGGYNSMYGNGYGNGYTGGFRSYSSSSFYRNNGYYNPGYSRGGFRR
jgi:hypothetical protein